MELTSQTVRHLRTWIAEAFPYASQDEQDEIEYWCIQVAARDPEHWLNQSWMVVWAHAQTERNAQDV